MQAITMNTVDENKLLQNALYLLIKILQYIGYSISEK